MRITLFAGQREFMTKLFICNLPSKIYSKWLDPKQMITVDSINIKI